MAHGSHASTSFTHLIAACVDIPETTAVCDSLASAQVTCMHLRLHVPGVRDRAFCELDWRSGGHTVGVALLHWVYGDADLIIVYVP